MIYVLLFFAGALLCNALPHIAAGVRGEPFPTPFAKPSGVGLSTPLTNFLCGSANLGGSVALLAWKFPAADLVAGLAAGALGWLAMGFFAALHFGSVRAKRGG